MIILINVHNYVYFSEYSHVGNIHAYNLCVIINIYLYLHPYAIVVQYFSGFKETYICT